MAHAFRRPDTAFSNAPIGKQAKRKRVEDKDHLAFIRTLPCVISGERPVDAAHIRYADPIYGKPETGKGTKPSDHFVIPLTRSKHDEQHRGDERAFWARHGLDPLRIALALHACSGDHDQANVILREAWASVKSFRPTTLWPSSSNEEIGDDE